MSPQPLTIYKLADRSDPGAQAADLPGAPPGTWPLAGVRIDDPPEVIRLSTQLVQDGLAQGWLEATGHQVVTRPAGTAADPWAPTPSAPTPHIFHHYDTVTFHTTGGDLSYRVTHQPDKYADHSAASFPDQVIPFDGDDDTPVTDEHYAAGATRVDWFYDLTREG